MARMHDSPSIQLDNRGSAAMLDARGCDALFKPVRLHRPTGVR
jgi:hypothetical protein